MPQTRHTHTCPICMKAIKKLSQHLRSQHGLDKCDAQQTSKKVQTLTEKEEKTKDGRGRYICGLERCGVNIVRRRQHLVRAHRLEPHTMQFQDAMNHFRHYQKLSILEIDQEEEDLAVARSAWQQPPRRGTNALTVPVRQQPPRRGTNALTVPAGQQPRETTGLTVPARQQTRETTAVTVPGQEQRLIKPMDKILSNYSAFLQSPEGGGRYTNIVDQHIKQIKMFWLFTKSAGLRGFTSTKLNEYIVSLVKNRKPGTIKSYMGSISQFCTYLHERRIMANEIYTSIQRFFRNSGKFLNRIARQRQVEHEESTRRELLPAEARTFVTESGYFNELCERFSRDPWEHFLEFRNAIMLLLTVTNATRVSSLQNLTIPQINQADKCVVEGVDYYVISVTEHKTSTSRHAQKLSLDKRVYGFLCMMASFVKASMNREEDRVFRKSQGGLLSTSTLMNKAIQAGWKACGGLRKYGRFNSTLNRKSVTCSAYDRDPDMAGKTAEQLKHRLSTAERYYRIHTASKTSAETVHFLNKRAPVTNPQPVPEGADARVNNSISTSVGDIDFPGLRTTSAKLLNRMLYDLTGSARITELVEEAASFRGKGEIRNFTLNYSYMAIHDALEQKVNEMLGIDLNDTIAMHLKWVDVEDISVKTTLMTVTAAELARRLGCEVDVRKNFFTDTLNAHSQRPPMRRRFSPSETQRISEVFGDYILHNIKENQNPNFKEIKELAEDKFPDITTLQLRDKIKNMMKQKVKKKK